MSWWTVSGLGFCTRNNWRNNLGKCNLSVFLGTWVDHDTNATWKKVWFESSEIWNRSFLQTPVETCSWKDTKKRRGLFSRQEQALWSDRFGWRWNFPFCTEIMQKYVGRQGIGLQWRKCCNWFSESVSMEEYEIVVCLTHENDERRSRKLHWMKAQVVVGTI